MKKILLGLSVLACAAAASVSAQAATSYPVCVSFAPSGYCDAMQYDGKKSATWHNYDCAGSQGLQTKAKYKNKAATTICDGTKGCNPSAAYGWDALNWTFNPKAGTGTLTGVTGGTEIVLQQDIPVDVSSGACAAAKSQGGVSSLTR